MKKLLIGIVTGISVGALTTVVVCIYLARRDEDVIDCGDAMVDRTGAWLVEDGEPR